jgi:hypothetical protein
MYGPELVEFSARPSRKIQHIAFVLTAVCYLYGLSVMFAVPYYNWQYARENGFAKWLLWGEIVPTLKGSAWPYYAFQHQSKADDPTKPLSQSQINTMHTMAMIRALNEDQQATYISSGRAPGVLLTPEQIARIIELDTLAFETANSTDEGVLNRLYPELGTRFKDHFQEGCRLAISGMKYHTREDLQNSKKLDQMWAEWYTTNHKAIEDALNAAIQ